MNYEQIEPHIIRWRKLNSNIDVWIDSETFNRENREHSPGATISKYGYWVIGVTVGGNAITVSDHDTNVRFCDHTGWYDGKMCFAAKRDYEDRPYTTDNVRDAQVVLAGSYADIDNIVKSGELEALIDKYD